MGFGNTHKRPKISLLRNMAQIGRHRNDFRAEIMNWKKISREWKKVMNYEKPGQVKESNFEHLYIGRGQISECLAWLRPVG